MNSVKGSNRRTVCVRIVKLVNHYPLTKIRKPKFVPAAKSGKTKANSAKIPHDRTGIKHFVENVVRNTKKWKQRDKE